MGAKITYDLMGLIRLWQLAHRLRGQCDLDPTDIRSQLLALSIGLSKIEDLDISDNSLVCLGMGRTLLVSCTQFELHLGRSTTGVFCCTCRSKFQQYHKIGAKSGTVLTNNTNASCCWHHEKRISPLAMHADYSGHGLLFIRCRFVFVSCFFFSLFRCLTVSIVALL